MLVFPRPTMAETVQTRELQEYCQRRGWTVSGEYVDVEISGTKEKRPELDRLLADAHRRRFDVVIVWRFDRFAVRFLACCALWRTSKPKASNLSVWPSSPTRPHNRQDGFYCLGRRGGG